MAYDGREVYGDLIPGFDACGVDLFADRIDA